MSKAVLVDHNFLQTIRVGANQKVSFTGTSAQATNAVAVTCTVVLLYATQNCWIKFAANPTAVANDGASVYLAAGERLALGIEPGHKIAVIRDTTSGDLHILEGG